MLDFGHDSDFHAPVETARREVRDHDVSRASLAQDLGAPSFDHTIKGLGGLEPVVGVLVGDEILVDGATRLNKTLVEGGPQLGAFALEDSLHVPEVSHGVSAENLELFGVPVVGSNLELHRLLVAGCQDDNFDLVGHVGRREVPNELNRGRCLDHILDVRVKSTARFLLSRLSGLALGLL